MSYDVLVVGCGPAGMMAAIAAAERGARVLVLERNEKAGKKLYITGKGRCNVTNAADAETLRGQIVHNGRFLFSALSQFDNKQLMALLERAGVPLKVERGGRVFPVSDKASDVTRALLGEMRRLGVEIRYDCRVRGVGRGETGFAVDCGGVCFAADKLIVATGGMAYPATGSTGDGYAWARDLGLLVEPALPSLVPVETVEDWPKELMGLSLKNVSLTLYEGKKQRFQRQGEMLFTHFGVSGPLVLEASAHLNRLDPANCRLSIDLKPALDPETLDKRLQRELAAHPNQRVDRALEDLLPRRMVPVWIRLAQVPQVPANGVTREMRQRLCATLKDWNLRPRALRSFEEAIVTRGGVAVKGINPSTMEAKQVPGLYFAGEVIDVDAYTGGYNLQIAFSTGFVAGNHAGNTSFA